ncbi:MAG: SMP-30/gluconolactonase/LRE family protein, partial [Acidobacteria bacterium]|nr:SMP-30/gluconolactonase/LRE family protein [Acidobacteriota bacterium]
ALDGPTGVAVDAAGNIYIADRNNNLVRKVGADGIITTVVGNGDFSFAGDGGLATDAALDPQGVAVDAAGNLYVADNVNARIRKIDTSSGIITTVAGTGEKGFSGDDGPATSAMLNIPNDVAVDGAGNLFIADLLNDRIRKVDLNGIITTVAGNGVDSFAGDGGPATAASLNEPDDMAVDAAGNLYIADTINSRIRKVASADGTIATLAGNNEFKFAGDGGPGTLAALDLPQGIAVDAAGNLFIADQENHRIRKLSPDGTITTVVGNGVFSFSGDGGQAVDASLGRPIDVAVDAAGNLYIAEKFNNRVRKVNTTGIITTVAGDGSFGFSGDGGQAINASLDTPLAVAVDGSGNLYISDNGNNRVRMVDANGIITTVAGNGDFFLIFDDPVPATSSEVDPLGLAIDAAGNLYIADNFNELVRKVDTGGIISTVAGDGFFGFSGDGGPATSASLNEPTDVAVDAAGNLYITDNFNERVRMVDTDGIISTVAGDGFSGFFGDGGSATSASLASPTGVAVDGAGNLYIAGSESDRIRKVSVAAPAFSVSPAQFSFSAPAGAPVGAAQQLAVGSSLTGLAWSAQAATQSGGNWLLLSPSLGAAPGSIDVSVDAGSLTEGSYSGTVTVTAPGASPSTQVVAVDLTVTAAAAAELAVEPVAMTFEAASGFGNPPAQELRIGNAGGGTLNWTAQAATVAGGSWLSVSPVSGTASAISPAMVEISANVAGLAAPAVYSGSIVVEGGSSGTKTVAVTLLLTQATQTIQLSQSGLLFTGVEGGGVAPVQTFGIANAEQGTMSWTAQATTVSGGGWLTVTPASGTSVAGTAEVPRVEVTANAGGLSAGQYGGLIQIDAPGASNSPQFVSVTLNVLAAGTNPGIQVRPRGLIFVRQAGTSSPGSQTVQVATAAPGSLEVVAIPGTFQGGNWLEAVPRNVTFSAGEPRTITVQPKLGTLAAGEYFGALTLLFSDRTSQTVNVLFVVTPAVSTASATVSSVEPLRSPGGAAQQHCVAQKLFTTGRSLGSNFASPVAWPSRIEAQVKDDCDNLVSDAVVVVSFSNGDPPLALLPLGRGIYEGTWRPVQSGAVRITVRAERTALTAAEAVLDGQVTDNPAAPALFAGGIVNAASFAPNEALAPGSIVSVFGRNLAEGLNLATELPLSRRLGGATLVVGGIEQPLFFSSEGQINAQLPFDLQPNSRPQVVVRTQRGSGAEVIGVPEPITIAAARPGIFALNAAGTGQGAILIAATGEVAAASGSIPGRAARPANSGDFLSIFCTGLGAVTNPPASGAPAAGDPLSITMATPSVTIDGVPARVTFSGLAPGFVGLYQVNVEVPQGVSPGAAVPLMLTISGVPSNTVTIAVE